MLSSEREREAEIAFPATLYFILLGSSDDKNKDSNMECEAFAKEPQNYVTASKNGSTNDTDNAHCDRIFGQLGLDTVIGCWLSKYRAWIGNPDASCFVWKAFGIHKDELWVSGIPLGQAPR